jgi:hypothetical protein
MKKLLSILILATSLNIAYAQGDLKISSNAQETLKFMNDPQNKNDILNNVQYQNDVELLMFIMKSIEDKNIKDKNKKIEFVNSFKASNDIKEWAISYINQNITYSDNEKISYGIYGLKKCNVGAEINGIPKANDCRLDWGPHAGCKPDRSNVCCQ